MLFFPSFYSFVHLNKYNTTLAAKRASEKCILHNQIRSIIQWYIYSLRNQRHSRHIKGNPHSVNSLYNFLL